MARPKSPPVPANRIRELRVRLHMTQAELASKVGLHYSAVSLHESMKRHIKPRDAKTYERILGAPIYE